MKIYDKLIAKEEKIAVVGLGYVGLPIALEFAKTTNVIGFDIKEYTYNVYFSLLISSRPARKRDSNL